MMRTLFITESLKRTKPNKMNEEERTIYQKVFKYFEQEFDIVLLNSEADDLIEFFKTLK